MIVCSCRRVSDHSVCDAIRQGASDVPSLGGTCGAGSRCGGCVPALLDLLASAGMAGQAA